MSHVIFSDEAKITFEYAVVLTTYHEKNRSKEK